MNGEIDVFETLSGVPFEPSAKKEPTGVTLTGIGDWITTVGSIFDRGMDVYDAFEGRVRANKIIQSEQVPARQDTIPKKVYIGATAEAIAEQFKRPIIIVGCIVVGLGLVLVYKQRR